MGWDVVQIGLRHNLPVDDPFATAKEVATRMNRNVRLVYMKEYEYDIEKNVVREAKAYEIIELAKFEVNDSKDYLRMIASNYQAQKILEFAGKEKLRNATFAGGFGSSILDDLENPYELYEIEDDEDSLSIRIFKENVDLDIFVASRWSIWEKAFHNHDTYRDWLYDYRLQIYKRAKIFGSQEVIICSDQGPTMNIYDNMDYSAEELKNYACSLQYLNDSNWLNESEKEEWKKNAKHIMFSSYFKKQLNLSDEDFIEVVYDDFSDVTLGPAKIKKDMQHGK